MNTCKGFYQYEKSEFKEIPLIIIIEAMNLDIKTSFLPKKIKVFGKNFVLLNTIIQTRPDHFESIFFLNNNYYQVDDLKPESISEYHILSDQFFINNAIYYLEE